MTQLNLVGPEKNVCPKIPHLSTPATTSTSGNSYLKRMSSNGTGFSRDLVSSEKNENCAFCIDAYINDPHSNGIIVASDAENGAGNDRIDP